MRKSAAFLLLLCVLFGALGISAAQSYERLARVSVATLHGSKYLSIEPLSEIGVILLAVDDCTITVNGSPVALKSGERSFVHGRQTVHVDSSDTRPVLLVIVNVRTARQAQTFNRVELVPGNVMEDASARGETLLVALTPLRLRDIIYNSDEDEPPNYGQPRSIELPVGKTTWLPPGMHQITNVGGSVARFVTIEW